MAVVRLVCVGCWRHGEGPGLDRSADIDDAVDEQPAEEVSVSAAGKPKARRQPKVSAKSADRVETFLRHVVPTTATCWWRSRAISTPASRR